MSVTQSSARHQRQSPVTRICGQTWKGRHHVIPDPSLVHRRPIILFFSVSQILQFTFCAQNYINSSIAIKLTSPLFPELLVTTICIKLWLYHEKIRKSNTEEKLLLEINQTHIKQQTGRYKFRNSKPNNP